MRAASKLLRPLPLARSASTAAGPKKVAVLPGDGIGEEVAALLPLILHATAL